MPTDVTDIYLYNTVDIVYHWCSYCRLFSQHSIMLADVANRDVVSGKQRGNYRVVCLLCSRANPAMDSL